MLLQRSTLNWKSVTFVEETAGREDRRRQEGCQGIVEEYCGIDVALTLGFLW